MEWYKYVNDSVLVMVMTESKPLDVINTLRKFADKVEASTVASDPEEE